MDSILATADPVLPVHEPDSNAMIEVLSAASAVAADPVTESKEEELVVTFGKPVLLGAAIKPSGSRKRTSSTPKSDGADDGSNDQDDEMKLDAAIIDSTFPRDLAMAAYKVRFTIKGHTRAVSAVRFSPNGLFLATASADRVCRIN